MLVLSASKPGEYYIRDPTVTGTAFKETNGNTVGVHFRQTFDFSWEFCVGKRFEGCGKRRCQC